MKKLFISAIMAASVLFGSLANAQTWTNVTGVSASKISCGADSRVVAISRETSIANNNTYRFTSDNGQWDPLNIVLTEVSIAASGGIRGVNASGSAQYFAPGATSWTGSSMPNNPFRKITTNGGISIAITGQTTNNIYRQNAGSGAWAILAGNGIASEASIANDSTLVVVGNQFGSGTLAYNLYQYKYSNNTWATLTGVMDKISVMSSGKMLGIKNNELFIYRNSAWSPAPLRADVIDLSVAADGTVYIATTASSNNVYRTTWTDIETAMAQTWTVVPANFVAHKISCGSASKVVSINATGNFYELKGSFDDWSGSATSFMSVAIARNGKVWGVSQSGVASYRTLPTGGFTNTTSPALVRIVASSARTYAIRNQASNNVYLFNGATWSVAPGAGIAFELAISEDDQFYAVGQTFGTGVGLYNLYRYNFGTSAWAAASGVMDKVAIGEAGKMLGIKNNELYIWENNVWRTTPVRTDVKDVAMASDGTIYIATTATTSNNIIRTTWNLIINATPVTSVKSFQKENTLVKIYPNPSKGAVHLELPELTNESMTYVVTNALGQEISSGVLTETKTTLNLSNGFYFVKIQSREGMSVQKVVVE